MPKDFDHTSPAFVCGFCAASQISALQRTIEDQQQQQSKPSFADVAKSIKEPSICATLVNEVQAEERRQQEKRMNLLVRGMVPNENLSDSDSVKQMANDVGVVLPSEEFTVKRIPPKTGQPDRNLILVTFKDAQKRMALLRKSKELRHQVLYTDVFINPDLTKAEQAKQYELRQLLRKQRTDEPNKKWFIRNNKVLSTAIESASA